MVTQNEIARRVGLDVSSVNKILNKRVGPRFRKDTIARVHRTARELGFDFGRLKHLHRRLHERQPVDIVAEVLVHRADGTLVEMGRAILKDLSRGGARVRDLFLPSGKLPLFPFEIRLRWRKGAGEDLARGRVIRFDHERGGLTLEFLEPPTRRGALAGREGK